jgi:hypothetical protein
MAAVASSFRRTNLERMDPSQVRETIAWRVADGRLPKNSPVYFAVGAGRGLLCNACGSRIELSDVEYLMEWTGGMRAQTARMHAYCYEQWKASAS